MSIFKFGEKFGAYIKTIDVKTDREWNTNTLHKVGVQSLEELRNFMEQIEVFEQLKEKYFTGLDG